MSDVLAKKDEYLEDIVGIDISSQGVIVSILNSDLNDPSTIVDAENNTRIIPLCIAKESGIGRWYIGEHAQAKAVMDGATKVDDIYEKAILKETIAIENYSYSYEELFATFLRRVIENNEVRIESLKKICITVPEVTERSVQLFFSVCSRLEIPKERFTLIDHKESFIYYTLSQNQNIYSKDVALFEYRQGKIFSNILCKTERTKPQIVKIDIDVIDVQDGEKDEEFASFINKVFKDRDISSVFLIGAGFEGDWMSKSVDILCEGTRVFLGDNLYSKGACYAGKVKLMKRPWNYVYIGDHEVKMNVSLKVSKLNDLTFINLVSAGDNWYEAGNECEVILDGGPEFECWVQSPETRQANIQRIELKKMPKRENRTTRLRISARPLSPTKVSLTIIDLGFGDISPSSGKKWEYTLDLEKES